MTEQPKGLPEEWKYLPEESTVGDAFIPREYWHEWALTGIKAALASCAAGEWSFTPPPQDADGDDFLVAIPLEGGGLGGDWKVTTGYAEDGWWHVVLPTYFLFNHDIDFGEWPVAWAWSKINPPKRNGANDDNE